MWLRDSVQHEKLPKLKDLQNPEFFPYRFGQAFWSYVGGRFGDGVIGRMLASASRSGPEQAIRSVLKVTPEELENDWHRSLSDQYKVVLQNTQLPSVFARFGDFRLAPKLTTSRIVSLTNPSGACL